MINVEIWASGGGTNAAAILRYFKNNADIKVVHLACSIKLAGAFDVALKHNIASSLISKKSWNSTSILQGLEKRKVDYIILAGFLKLVPAEVVSVYRGRMLNLHPSLLPKYGGKNMYGEHVHNAVLSNKESVSGITIHEVNREFDKGKIIAQFSTTFLSSNEDLSSLKKKIQVLEHSNFPRVIESWIKSKVT